MTDEHVDGLVAEADAPKRLSFEFGGEQFHTRTNGVDLRVMVALQRNDFHRALRILLGPAELERLLDIDTDDVIDEARLSGILDTWARGAGTSLGESSASASS